MSSDDPKRGRLTDDERSLLALVERSRDHGEGWRRVAPAKWPLVARWQRPELLEVEADPAGGGRVRLTHDGRIVMRYLS